MVVIGFGAGLFVLGLLLNIIGWRMQKRAATTQAEAPTSWFSWLFSTLRNLGDLLRRGARGERLAARGTLIAVIGLVLAAFRLVMRAA